MLGVDMYRRYLKHVGVGRPKAMRRPIKDPKKPSDVFLSFMHNCNKFWFLLCSSGVSTSLAFFNLIRSLKLLYEKPIFGH